MNIRIDDKLPVAKTYKASNLDSKEEIDYWDGKTMTHAFRIGRTLVVSEEVWKTIRELPTRDLNMLEHGIYS